MPESSSKEQIVADIKEVARRLGTGSLSRQEYVQHGHYSEYQLYDGGSTWEQLAEAAGVRTKKREPVPTFPSQSFSSGI